MNGEAGPSEGGSPAPGAPASSRASERSPTQEAGPSERGQRQQGFVRPAGSCEILLIRHGESAAAEVGVPFPLVDGHGDPPLHVEGHRQAEALADRLEREHRRGPAVDAIYVTTLQRTVQTITPFAERVAIEPRVEPDLREVFLGEWEGGLFRHKAAEGDPVFRRIASEERWDVIPGAEPLERFDTRVVGALAHIAAGHPDQRVVVVSHGGVIGQLLHHATGSRRFAFAGAENASISVLVVVGDRWIVRTFNDTSHLDPPTG